MPLPRLGRVTLRLAVLDDYQRAAGPATDWSVLDGRAEVTVFHDHTLDAAETVSRLRPFDAVIAMRERTPFPAAVLDALPGLRLLVTTGPVNAAIDLAAAARNGVTVCGTGGVGAATPELTWALMLAVTRRLPRQDAAVRSGGWQHDIGPELAGSTLGLLGLGRIGTRLCRYAAAFDMDVVAWSANLTDERARGAGAVRVGFDELFTRADVLAVTTQLSDRTRGIVGARELDLLGPSSYLVNTSRGPVVQEAALLEALRRGRIAGAGLDVYDVEPLAADHPLRSAPNTVLTPHTGYVSTNAYEVFYREAVEDVLAWLDGAPLRELTA